MLGRIVEDIAEEDLTQDQADHDRQGRNRDDPAYGQHRAIDAL